MGRMERLGRTEKEISRSRPWKKTSRTKEVVFVLRTLPLKGFCLLSEEIAEKSQALENIQRTHENVIEGKLSESPIKFFCILYASVGIPLALVTVGNFSKFTADYFSSLYWYLKWTSTPSISIINESDEMDMDEESYKAPLYFLMAILLLFVAFCALIFQQTDTWPFADSFYYCLVTAMTIGLGDLVPEMEGSSLALSIIFIFLGLIIATMCIDSMAIHYIEKIHYFGRNIYGLGYILNALGDRASSMKEWMLKIHNLQDKYGLTSEQLKQIIIGSNRRRREDSQLSAAHQSYTPDGFFAFIDQ
ncbi:Ion trans 2 domain containing protein [Trichuris trichiura]|uniref:Ion trans 2 domain containing protein n=1 Tax=Trichuris trichiura TaxID=36087 RepID=A0A077YYM6_TRITR|nr:Ion trans 2 domain containing protein [Trichuris trichiura]